MRTPALSARILSLLQLILVLPPMVSGSVCIPASGSESLELGFCACATPFQGTGETAIGTPGTPDCGPCRDEAFSALRAAPPAAAPVPLLASPIPASGPIVLASSVAEPPAFRLGAPPGRRLPILRC